MTGTAVDSGGTPYLMLSVRPHDHGSHGQPGRRMTPVFSFIRRLVADETGSTAIEYGIMVGMIFLAIVAGIQMVTSETNAMYTYIEKSITAK